jgi:WD40 repeat protein
MFAMSIVDQHSFPILAAPEITSLTSGGVGPKLSPDGRWVAHAAADLTVRVFEASTGKEVASIRQPRTENSSGKAVNFTAIAISKEALALATGEGQLSP